MMYKTSVLVLFLLSSILLLQTSTSHKAPCLKYDDTFGEWINSSTVNKTSASKLEYESHFYGGGSGEALQFTQVWVPSKCSYHRFTNHSLNKCIDYTMKNNFNISNQQVKDRLHVMIVGDSASRGIFCGIGRLFSGSEVYGPSINNVCGGPGTAYGLPVSTSKYGVYVDVEFNANIQFTFVYVKTFYTRHFDWLLEYMVSIVKPYAVVMNTGAWDFDSIARSHPNVTEVSERCDTNETQAISDQRSATFVNDTLWYIGQIAKSNSVRVIYRNNHYNSRFGTLCADEKLELLLPGSGWEIWDNRRISKDVWKVSCIYLYLLQYFISAFRT